MSKRRYGHRRSRSRSNSDGVELSKQDQMILLFSIGLVAVGFVVYKILVWIRENWILFTASIIGLLVLLGIIYYYFGRDFLAKRKDKRVIEDIRRMESANLEISKLKKDLSNIDLRLIRNEENFEDQMYQWLKAKDYDVKYQVKLDYYKKIDLVVNGKNAKYGIELKLAGSNTILRNLYSQIKDYKKKLNNVIAVIVLDEYKESYKEYLDDLKEITDDNVIILNGKVRRKSNKKTFLFREDKGYRT